MLFLNSIGHNFLNALETKKRVDLLYN